MRRIKEFIENYAIAFARFGLVSAAILFFVGSIGVIYSFCDKDEHTLKYDETNSKIDYRVNLLKNNSYDFIMAIGDDTTDDDMFRALPEGGVSIKVGDYSEAAQFRLPWQDEVVPFLEGLIK